jgi:hypothetical protein
VIAENAGVAQIDIAFAAQAGAPVFGHLGDGFRSAGECTRKGIFHAAVDHALGGEGLVTPQGVGFKQGKVKTGVFGAVSQPEPGNTAANNGQIELDTKRGLAHGNVIP